MKINFLLHQEWQQFKAYQRLRYPSLFILILLYVFFIYRYVGITQEHIPGNIVSFLNVQGNLTEYLILNMTSLLFYTLPLIYLGQGWLYYMVASNEMIKIRQPFSFIHFIYGECVLVVINILWLIINQIIYGGLHLPFANFQQYIPTLCLLMLIGNILLGCFLKGGELIGWIIILLFYPLVCQYYPSLFVLTILLLMIILFNIYSLKRREGY